jgi:hypothetical protein
VKTLRAIAVMLLPPAVLFGLAHMVPGSLAEEMLVIPLMILLAGAGLAAVATSGWRRPVRIGVGVAYGLGSVAALPLLALVAVCSTGNCL